MCKGFVKIPRRLFETSWWNQNRVYSESDAIIDLYSSADRKNMVSVTIRSLADKWYWEQTRVLRFIQKLTKEGYIETTKSMSGTTIKIIDFGVSATQPATLDATPSATPENEKCNTKTPINTGFDDSRCNTIDLKNATPSATPTATQPATSSRAYMNDIFKSMSIEENSKNNKSDSSQSSESPSRSKRFIKPTIQEISEYCAEKGYNIDAESFWNFYESKGWVVGKSPMKNWKAACATWNKKRTIADPTRLNSNSTNKFQKFSW